MKKLLHSLLKIGSTITTVAISTACGADREIAIAMGTMVGTTVSSIVDLSVKR